MAVDLVLIVVISVICQAVTEQIKKAVKFPSGWYGRLNFKVILSIVISLAMCVSYQIDLLGLLGLDGNPIVGQIITGIVVAGGSTTIHELIKKINEARQQ